MRSLCCGVGLVLLPYCSSRAGGQWVFSDLGMGQHTGSQQALKCVHQCSGRLRLKCDGRRTETRFRLSAERKSPFKSAGGVISVDYWQPWCAHRGSNAVYTMFCGSVKSTGYPLHSPVSPSLPLPCVSICHHISTGLYRPRMCC
jgi:hypothetical protein